MKAFGDFRFDDERRQLTCAGRAVPLTGQSLDLLCLLLERPGALISREEIRDRLWPGTKADIEHGLDVVVSRLRTTLRAENASHAYIETVPRKGYRFIEPVAVHPGPRLNTSRPWTRRYLPYAVAAVLASILTILFARSRYERFVPAQDARASATSSSP